MPIQVNPILDYDTGYPNKKLVLTWPDFQEMYDFLSKVPVLILDFETSGLDWFAGARACGIALGSWDDRGDLLTYYVPFRHATGEKQLTFDQIQSSISSLLSNPKTLKIAHNIKFDEHIANCDGWSIEGPRYDTMIAARLYDENRLAGLKQRAVEDLDRPEATEYEKKINDEVYRLAKENKILVKAYREQYGYSQVNIPLLGTYACFDVEFTGLLYKFYESLGISSRYSYIWNIEMRLTRVLCEMEARGLPIDVNYLEALRSALGGYGGAR